MDEPSSGLDPASRKALWSAVKSAKRDRAIILTSTVYTTPRFIDICPFTLEPIRKPQRVRTALVHIMNYFSFPTFSAFDGRS
jgi:hypothetical protein